MKRIITLFLLVVFSTAFYTEKSEEDSLNLELTSNMRSPRVGQRITIELKIIGQAIAEIITDTNDIESINQNKPEFVYKRRAGNTGKA